MNAFDKFCAVPAFVLGGIFLILGGMGVIFGCRANFNLPPILGGLPALIGWGICRTIYLAWSAKTGGSSVPLNQPTFPHQDQPPRF